MPNPFAALRDKLPPRLRSAFSRRWYWKDLTIAGLGLLVVVLAGYAFREPLAAALPGWLKPGPEGEEVKVFDVVLDREGRAFVDVLFDRPLGQGAVGGRLPSRDECTRGEPLYSISRSLIHVAELVVRAPAILQTTGAGPDPDSYLTLREHCLPEKARLKR
ncbi:MAG TPA: hypothetical protein VF121_01195 [Thermoanaerobaculia bacterium]|nr:hypothetical protein [Thermoanaerobaculia bacterium]